MSNSNMQISATLELIDRISAPLNRIQLPLERTQRAFDQAREAVQNLERQGGRLRSFAQRSEQVNLLNRQLTEARQRMNDLRNAMNSTQNPSQRLINQFNRAETAVLQLQNQLSREQNTLNYLNTQLRQAGVNTNNLAQAQNRLQMQTNQARASLERENAVLNHQLRIRQQFEQSMQRWQNIRSTSLAMAGAGALTMAVPIRAFSEAEDAAMSLKVSMMDSTGKVAPEFEKINALAEKLGTSLPGSSAEFSNMMAKLVQQGISFQDILGGVGEASANLAVVMKMPFADAAEFAAKMQDATKTSAQDMIQLMDTIQKSYYLGVDSTNMLSGFSKLADGMKTVRMQGLEGAKAMAPLLVMADQASMAGESAGNAFSKIFKAMMDTDKIKKAFNKNAIKMQMNFTDGKGEFGGFDNMFKQLEKLKSLSTEKRLPLLADMFGNDSETIQALNLLIDKGKAGYEETIAKMQSQADLQQRVNAQLSTLANIWDSAKGTFTSVMVTFGEALAPTLKDLVGFITDITEKVGDWSKQHPTLTQWIMKTLGVIVLLTAGLAILSTVMLAIIGPLAMVLASISTIGSSASMFAGFATLGSKIMAVFNALKTVATFLMANPIIMAIILIATAIYLIYQNWEPIKQFFSNLWQNVTAGLQNFWTTVVGIWQNLVNSITTFVSGLWQTITGLFDNGIAGLVRIILAFNPVNLFTQIFSMVFNYLSGLGSQFASYGANLIEGLKNGILSKAQAVINSIQTVASKVKSAFTGMMGIHSPSRVFLGYGDNIMQGLNNGLIANGSPIDTMLKVSDGLKNAIDTSQIQFDNRKPIMAQSNSGHHAPVNQNISINIYAQPHQSEQDIARLVAQELAKTNHQNPNTALYDYVEAWT